MTALTRVLRMAPEGRPNECCAERGHRTSPMTRARAVPRTFRSVSSWGEASPGLPGQVESIEVHDLVPRGHEVAHELLLRVVARVDLGDRPELGVGAEDQVEPAAGPLQLARPAIT